MSLMMVVMQCALIRGRVGSKVPRLAKCWFGHGVQEKRAESHNVTEQR